MEFLQQSVDLGHRCQGASTPAAIDRGPFERSDGKRKGERSGKRDAVEMEKLIKEGIEENNSRPYN